MAPKSSEQFEEIRNQSRAKIVVAALELFAIDGYHNTSISKIAKHAGISKGLMYNYFDSKEELLNEVVLMSLADAKEEMEEKLMMLGEVDPSDLMKIMLNMFFEMLVKNKTMWKLTFSLSLQVTNIPSVKETIYAMFSDLVTKMEFLFQVLGEADYQLEAKIIAAQLDGIAIHYILFEDDYPLEEVKNKLIEKYTNTSNNEK